MTWPLCRAGRNFPRESACARRFARYIHRTIQEHCPPRDAAHRHRRASHPGRPRSRRVRPADGRAGSAGPVWRAERPDRGADGAAQPRLASPPGGGGLALSPAEARDGLGPARTGGRPVRREPRRLPRQGRRFSGHARSGDAGGRGQARFGRAARRADPVRVPAAAVRDHARVRAAAGRSVGVLRPRAPHRLLRGVGRGLLDGDRARAALVPGPSRARHPARRRGGAGDRAADPAADSHQPERAAEVPRFRVSYTFTDQFAGDESAIRKAIRDLSFSTVFDPGDLNDWRVCRTEGGDFLLQARRTLVDEIFETTERAALRKFLYGMDLPDTINVANIHIERIEEPAGGEAEGEAAA